MVRSFRFAALPHQTDKGPSRPSPRSALPAHSRFTAVFDGDLRRFAGNPFLTDTPFGRPVSIGVDDFFAVADHQEQLIEELADAIADLLPYAAACVGLPRDVWPADSVILRAEAAVQRARGNTPEDGSQTPAQSVGEARLAAGQQATEPPLPREETP